MNRLILVGITNNSLMKRCLACGVTFPSKSLCCSACGAEPISIDGFPAYAPDLAHSGGGFKASYFADLAQLEARHFWFKVRNQLIVWAIKTYCPQFRSLLEIGCGTGYVLSGIAEAYPHVKLQGSEIFTAGLAFAAERQPTIDFMQMDGRNIPFVDEFDAIGAFDVLEHIEEDQQVLVQMYKALKHNGIVFITVPQHLWMWSQADSYAHHVRRYTANELRGKVENASFQIIRITSFMSLLLPLMFLSRLRQRQSKTEYDPISELKISGWLNTVFKVIFNLERMIIRFGLSLPVGGSLLLVAKKI